MKTDQPTCIIAAHWGQYLPQRFTEIIPYASLRGVDRADYETLAAGPDHEGYWDAWDAVTTAATYIDNAGRCYYLQPDGDLWLVPVTLDE